MGKHARIAAQVAGLTGRAGSRYHACYLEYFRLFNARGYYEAHDVLEHIWLGAEGEIRDFYKALIQFAGGFVHLQHHHREPLHRIHGRRLRPAERMFRRCAELLGPFPGVYEGLDVAGLRIAALAVAHDLARGAYAVNPWMPANAPKLELRS